MDYCSSCRRHLNGALVCPGCGAYAPDIAPSAVAGPPMTTLPGAAVTGATAWQAPADDTWYDGYFRDEAAPAADMDETAPVAPAADLDGDPADPDGVPAAPQGRAARRRQRARWKKNQRRAVVATAVALVGGGLTVSAMDRGSSDKALAATAPENPNTAAEQQATELTRPASTSRDTREAPSTSESTSKPTPTNAARVPVTPPHTTRQFTRPDVATTPGPVAPGVPQTQTVSPASPGANSDDNSGTAAEQQQTPTPTATEGSGSGSDTGTSTSPASPAPEENSPAQLCVLNLVCLG